MFPSKTKGGSLAQALVKPPLLRSASDALALEITDPDQEEVRRSLDVEGQLRRVKELLAAYGLDRKSAPELHGILGDIDEHEREVRLFLGIVGESSGDRHALINALLRETFFQSEGVLANASAPILLSYGTTLAVEVRKHPGPPLLRLFGLLQTILSFVANWIGAGTLSDRKKLRAHVHEAVTGEEGGGRVAQVNVSHPAECLKRGMVIVDLPGTFAQNARESILTAHALTSFCDATIIVIPAHAAGSEAMWTFLRASLAPEFVKRCVFALTNANQVHRPDERQQLITNFLARLARDLGVEKPQVVSIAPSRVLEAERITSPSTYAEPEVTPDERAAWLLSFQEAERALWATLRKEKLLQQVDRLNRLLSRVIDGLKTTLRDRETRYEARHAALLEELNRIPDSGRFVADSQTMHCEEFTRSANPRLQQAERDLVSIREATLRTLRDLVFKTTSIKELRTTLETLVPRELTVAQRSVATMLQSTLEAMERIAGDEYRAFEARLRVIYENLATLDERIPAGAGRLPLREARSLLEGMSSLKHFLTNTLRGTREYIDPGVLGGAGAGAAIGSLVLPGVGTVIGGMLGGFVGSLFGPSLLEAQERCWEQLQAAVNASFARIIDQTQPNLAQARAEIERALAAAVGRCADAYNGLRDEFVSRDNLEAEALVRFRHQVAGNLAEIRNYQHSLVVTQAHLETLRTGVEAQDRGATAGQQGLTLDTGTVNDDRTEGGSRFNHGLVIVDSPGIGGFVENARAQGNVVRVTQSAAATDADGSAVDCTIFAPPTVRQGESFIVQVFAHSPELTRQAAEFAKEFDESASRRGFKCLESRVNIGSTLSVCPISGFKPLGDNDILVGSLWDITG